MTALSLIALGLPIGCLIGLIGIGGVLLAPALVYIFGRDIHEAVSLGLASFVPAGVVAAMRVGDAPPPTSNWLFLAAIVPGSMIGALTTPLVPEMPLSLLVSACVAFGGLSCLRRPTGGDRTTFGSAVLGGLGVLTGLLSAVSGTGGPLICLPLLLWKGMEVRGALLLAQIAQLPVAGTATLVNSYRASVDFFAATIIGLAIVAGMLAGFAISRRIKTETLRTSVAWCLVIVGLALCASQLLRLVAY